MTRKSPRSPTRLVRAAVVMAGLGLVPACGDDAPTTPPRTGIIEGQVSDGAPLSSLGLQVVAEGLHAGQPLRVTAEVDDDGRYTLAVPDGAVVVYLDSSLRLYHRTTGLTANGAEADTLRVAGGTHRVDFVCGRVRAAIDLSPAVRSGWWRCEIHPEDRAEATVAAQQIPAAALLVADLRCVPPGRYRLGLRSEHFGQVYLPPTFDFAGAAVIEVAAGELTDHVSQLAGVATLEGSVTGSWQALGLDPPEVRAYYSPEDHVGMLTSPDGSFAMRMLAGEAYRIEVNIGGVSQWLGGRSYATATSYPLLPGQTVSGIDHLESGLECIYSPTSLPPTYLDDVTLLDDDGNARTLVVVGGRVVAANLQPGPVTLRLSAWDRRALWLPQYWDRRATSQAADPIAIPDGGQVAQVMVTLEKGGRILGRLRDAAGNVPDPATLFVVVHAATDSLGVHAIYTNQDFVAGLFDATSGAYLLTRLADGQYRLRAHIGQDPWIWWPGRAAWDSAGVIGIADHADVPGIDWNLPR
jgi:hypothetical protein